MDIQLHVQLVVSWNPVHGEVYSIQHYVIKCACNLWQFCGFIRVLRFLPLKNDHHDIAEILLKVALNTIKLSIFYFGNKGYGWVFFHQYFRNIILVTFIRKGNRSTEGKTLNISTYQYRWIKSHIVVSSTPRHLSEK